MGKRLALVLGGARSGKSDFAQALALKRAGGDVLFVATAEALDDEMRARIALHRAARDLRWRTLEAPRRVAQALATAPHAKGVLIDCLTVWTSNILLASEPTAEQELARELNDLFEWYQASNTELIIVSNEVGMGLVPEYELGRAYRDLLGTANQQVAANADEVFWLCAGIPLELKARAVRLEEL